MTKRHYTPTLITTGSVALNENTGCTQIKIKRTSLPKIKTPQAVSAYTSAGRRKASPAEPLRSKLDIKRIMNFYLMHGKKELRLRNYTIFVLGISVGLRAGDLLSLRVRDVVDERLQTRSQLTVCESKTHKMNYPYLNAAARTAVSQYVYDGWGTTFTSMEDYLFPSEKREKISENMLYVMMRNAQKKLQLPCHFSTHSLRKTFAYWNIKLHKRDAGTMACLQEMLNHDSMKTTLHYAGQTQDKYKTLYEDLDALFDDKELDDDSEFGSDGTEDILQVLCEGED